MPETVLKGGGTDAGSEIGKRFFVKGVLLPKRIVAVDEENEIVQEHISSCASLVLLRVCDRHFQTFGRAIFGFEIRDVGRVDGLKRVATAE